MECVLKTSDLCLLSTVIGLHCSMYHIFTNMHCTLHTKPVSVYPTAAHHLEG